MGFKPAVARPSASDADSRPRRAPSKAALAAAAQAQRQAAEQATAQAQASFESHEFPSFYEPEDSVSATAPVPAAHFLDPRLERLIELACSELGCPPEELEHLKTRAVQARQEVESFCQMIFDQRVRPRRERPDPLARAPGSPPVAFWLEGQAGRAVVEAPDDSPLRAYAGGRLELYHPLSSPFAARARDLPEGAFLAPCAAPGTNPAPETTIPATAPNITITPAIAPSTVEKPLNPAPTHALDTVAVAIAIDAHPFSDDDDDDPFGLLDEATVLKS